MSHALRGFLARQAIQLRDRGKAFDLLADLEQSQWLTPAELRTGQWPQITDLLDHCYRHVPYYRAAFDAAGVAPKDIVGWNDFLKVPLLKRSDIQLAGVGAFRADNCRSQLRTVRTGGSTGAPLVFELDVTTSVCANANRNLGKSWWGVAPSDPEALIWGYSAGFSLSWRAPVRRRLQPIKDAALNKIVCSAYALTDDTMYEFYQRLRAQKPSALTGYASALFILAGFLRRRGLPARELQLKVIISTSEILYASQRLVVEDTFGAKVANEYGAVELGIIAFECPAGNWHLMDPSLYVEIVDEQGHPLPDGQAGEVVITHLRNLSTPLVRYRLGDFAALSTHACSCGRGLRVLEGIQSRTHDLIRRADGGFAHGEMFTHIFDHVHHVRQFQVVQQTVQEFTISVVKEEGFGQDEEDYISARVREMLGRELIIHFRYPPAIEREASGKCRWIRSLISDAECDHDASVDYQPGDLQKDPSQ